MRAIGLVMISARENMFGHLYQWEALLPIHQIDCVVPMPLWHRAIGVYCSVVTVFLM